MNEKKKKKVKQISAVCGTIFFLLGGYEKHFYTYTILILPPSPTYITWQQST